jgi:hypothetical protein
MKRIFAVGLVVAGAAAVVLGPVGSPEVRGADHGDSPQVRVDGRADINDVYVFASPENAANTVLVMTVSPLAGIVGRKEFATKTAYTFAIDVNGDAKEDQTYTLGFTKPDATGHQKFVLAGPAKLKVKGETESTVTVGTGGKVFCGLRDDPFFFDLIGFKHLSFSPATAHDFFDGLNTMAIVLEVPTASFGTLTNSTMGVWARTRVGRKQIDRMGRPAINTVLIPGAKKDAFNSGSPKDDVANFRADVIATLTAAPYSRTATDAGNLATALLPDVLTYDPTNAGGFLNGRKLTDDVIDAELGLLTNGAISTDFVGNDSTFLTTFPYLAAPNP